MEIVELTRNCVLENLVSDFYHSSDEHVKAAIDLHRGISQKYPNFYLELFSDPAFRSYFMDAHKAMATLYLLYHHDEAALGVALEGLKSVQVNRIGNAYGICRMANVFGVSVPKSVLRSLFYKHAEHIEKEKGRDYVGFLGVKYAKEFKQIFATLRVKKEKLVPAWQEVMAWVFTRDTDHDYTSKVMKEVVKLRKHVQTGKKPRFVPKLVPFTVWRGYAKHLGMSEEEIFKNHHLMTHNEVKRNLATLEKHGLLVKKEERGKIQRRIDKVEVDLISLFYALKALDNNARDMLMTKGKVEYEKNVAGLGDMLKDRNVAVAVDCSMGGSGFTNLLDPEMQKRVANGEDVPRWAKIVQRESFNANVIIGKMLTDASKRSRVFMFNETVNEADLTGTFEELVDALKEAKPDGGSNILKATETLIAAKPDIAFIITDMNENVPFQGALRSQIESLAKEFNGLLIFITTETIVERNVSTMIDDIIKEKKLHNVMVVPVKKARHLMSGLVIMEVIARAKALFIRVEVKKKKKKREVEQ